MDPRDANSRDTGRIIEFPRKPVTGKGRIYPSEVRALIGILATHLQRQPEQADVARLRNTASSDPDSYLLFFGDEYLGSITRIPANGEDDHDEFLHDGPVA